MAYISNIFKNGSRSEAPVIGQEAARGAYSEFREMHRKCTLLIAHTSRLLHEGRHAEAVEAYHAAVELSPSHDLAEAARSEAPKRMLLRFNVQKRGNRGPSFISHGIVDIRDVYGSTPIINARLHNLRKLFRHVTSMNPGDTSISHGEI